MTGAREYAGLFATGQVGKFYFVSGSHARGKTFEIFILAGEKVKVYGVISGQPGWAETYGWLHHGPWVAEFEKLVEIKREEQRIALAEKKLLAKKKKEEEAERVKKLLES